MVEHTSGKGEIAGSIPALGFCAFQADWGGASHGGAAGFDSLGVHCFMRMWPDR